MKNFYDSDFRIGILGGGQLGRMLIQKAADFNISTNVLDADPDAPCRSLCTEFFRGEVSDYETVLAFGMRADLITIEFEHVNTDALEELEKRGKKVFPQASVIRLVQDKGLQKQFYQKHNLPSADFRLVNNRIELEQNASFAPFFQKLRRSGYDGKGVKAIKKESHVSDAFDAPSVLEKFVDFEREIAVIVARNERGEIKTYPPVELDFNTEANLVEYLFSPASLKAETAWEAENLAVKVIETLQMVGLLAVEMFLTKDGKILINEIAPRPHNSGHHTIEANNISQFEQHLRAILNLPLGDTAVLSPAVMLNLLGERDYNGAAVYNNLPEVLGIPGVHLHLYGKGITKPFRKMGHVTVTSTNRADAHKKAELVKNLLTISSTPKK